MTGESVEGVAEPGCNLVQPQEAMVPLLALLAEVAAWEPPSARQGILLRDRTPASP